MSSPVILSSPQTVPENYAEMNFGSEVKISKRMIEKFIENFCELS